MAKTTKLKWLSKTGYGIYYGNVAGKKLAKQKSLCQMAKRKHKKNFF